MVNLFVGIFVLGLLTAMAISLLVIKGIVTVVTKIIGAIISKAKGIAKVFKTA